MASDAFRFEGSGGIELFLIRPGSRRNQCEPSYKHRRDNGQRHHFECLHIPNLSLNLHGANSVAVVCRQRLGQWPCRASFAAK
jgi:hypothetical protein